MSGAVHGVLARGERDVPTAAGPTFPDGEVDQLPPFRAGRPRGDGLYPEVYLPTRGFDPRWYERRICRNCDFAPIFAAQSHCVRLTRRSGCRDC